MPYQGEAIVVLAMWNDIEQQLSAVARETAEEARLLDEWARLRTEYQRLVELAGAHHRPAPPPWPDAALERRILIADAANPA
jgi:hypothetical protein